MPYCFKCGKEIDEISGFCPHCGVSLSAAKSKKKNEHVMSGGIFALLCLAGCGIGAFLLIGGLVAAIMNPIIESTPKGGRVWAVGQLDWMIFYPTGLINYCFLIGIISLGVGIGSYILMEKVS